jgi:hypothetical protein
MQRFGILSTVSCMPCSPALRTEDFGLLKHSWQYIEDAGALPDIFATLPEENTILEGPVQEEYEEVLRRLLFQLGPCTPCASLDSGDSGCDLLYASCSDVRTRRHSALGALRGLFLSMCLVKQSAGDR